MSKTIRRYDRAMRRASKRLHDVIQALEDAGNAACEVGDDARGTDLWMRSSEVGALSGRLSNDYGPFR